jgi:YHS domain-containing protein
MEKSPNFMCCLILSIFAIGNLHAAECKCAVTEVKEEAKKNDKVMKCPVDSKKKCGGSYCSNDVKDDLFVEHEGRKVLFCCEGCIDIFKKNPNDFAEQIKAQWIVIDSKKEEKK